MHTLPQSPFLYRTGSFGPFLEMLVFNQTFDRSCRSPGNPKWLTHFLEHHTKHGINIRKALSVSRAEDYFATSHPHHHPVNCYHYKICMRPVTQKENPAKSRLNAMLYTLFSDILELPSSQSSSCREQELTVSSVSMVIPAPSLPTAAGVVTLHCLERTRSNYAKTNPNARMFIR